jgi:hypothetical protein
MRRSAMKYARIRIASSVGPAGVLRLGARFFVDDFRAAALPFLVIDFRLAGVFCCSPERIPSDSAADLPAAFPSVNFDFRATILRWIPNTVHV